MKKIMMSFSILILVVLLLLPPGLRIFGKNLYTDKPVKKKDEVYVLNCTNTTETINLSYLNDRPYNFQYLIKGNYIDLTQESDVLSNHILDDIRYYSEFIYNEIDDTTEYRLAFYQMDDIPEQLKNYSMTFDEQSQYYNNNGFSCTKVSY